MIKISFPTETLWSTTERVDFLFKLLLEVFDYYSYSRTDYSDCGKVECLHAFGVSIKKAKCGFNWKKLYSILISRIFYK